MKFLITFIILIFFTACNEQDNDHCIKHKNGKPYPGFKCGTFRIIK